MSLEWQVANGSTTAHVMDLSRPEPRRTGRQSLCKRRPQRNERAWFALPVADPHAIGVLRGYSVRPCGDCTDALPAPVADPDTTNQETGTTR